MTGDDQLRDQVCELARSMFDRGLTWGSTGNISVRTASGGLLVSPTGTSFGRLDPARLSQFDAEGRQIDGDPPTKEMHLHSAFYDTRPNTGAVVYETAGAYAVTLQATDPDDVLPPLTAYSIMQLGKVKLLPFFVPGDPAMGEAVRDLAGRRSAVLLANHGPVVAAESLEAAGNAIEELEYTARLAMLTRGHAVRLLTDDQVRLVVDAFDIDWDT